MSETTLEDVKSEIQALAGNIKDVADTALKQAEDGGKVAASAKEKALELLNKQGELLKSQKQLESRLLEIEQNGASRLQKPEGVKSVGQIVAGSDELKAFAADGGRGTFRYTVDNAITSVTPGAGGLIWSDRETEPVRLPMRRMTIRQLLTQGSTSSNLIEYAKQTVRTNNAAPVAETAQKPESTYAWDKADAPVRTIAHFAHISRQAMDDAAQLQTEIDGELRYGLDLEEENQLLSGDGVGENLSGLITEATAYAPAFVPTAESAADKIMLAILQASLTEYPADGIVMHPTDWARIALTKDADGNYIAGGPQSVLGQTLWGLPVIATQAIEVDKFLVGAFRMAATIYDRMSTEILISSEDRDNFIKNMLTVRAEKRLALAVKRPAALTYGGFGNVA